MDEITKIIFSALHYAYKFLVKFLKNIYIYKIFKLAYEGQNYFYSGEVLSISMQIWRSLIDGARLFSCRHYSVSFFSVVNENY